jgi:hypothetical protein
MQREDHVIGVRTLPEQAALSREVQPLINLTLCCGSFNALLSREESQLGADTYVLQREIASRRW